MDEPKSSKTYSVSRLRTFSSCHRRDYFSSILKITPKVEPIPWLVGRAFHRALNEAYLRESKKSGRAALRAAFNKALKNRFLSALDHSYIELQKATTEGMYNGFCEIYLKKDLANWIFIEFERTFKLKMPNGRAFFGIIDGLVEVLKGKNKGIWVLENKTASRINPFTVQKVKLDIQLLGYLYAGCRLIRGEKLKGVIYFQARKSFLRLRKGETFLSLIKRVKDQYLEDPKKCFSREFLRFPKKSVESFEKRFDLIASDIERCMKSENIMEAYYQNSDMCDSFGMCPYFPLCKKGMKDRILAYFKKRVWEK